MFARDPHLLTRPLLQQAFFDKDYISSHPEDTERITHLKDLMQEQVRLSAEFNHIWNSYLNILFSAFCPLISCEQVHILGVGLAVHEKLVHPEMRPLHKKLVDQFHMMRTGLHHVSSPTCGSVFSQVLFSLTKRHNAAFAESLFFMHPCVVSIMPVCFHASVLMQV